MKILIFTDSLRGGGKERRIGELIKGILKKDNNIKFQIASMDPEIGYSIFSELNIQINFLLRKSKKDLSIIWKLYKLCKEFKPDIIHTWDPMTSIYAILVAGVLRIKFVNCSITVAPLKTNYLNKHFIRYKIGFLFSDVIISNSKAGLKSFNSPTKKSLVIYNGFDFERVKNLKSKKMLKSNLGIITEKIVCMVANFTDNKDYHSFFDMAKEIISKRDDVTFVTAGEGPYLKGFKDKVDNTKSASRIKILGRFNDVESLLNICNIGVLTSKYNNFGEGISNSIMEYMALAKPVIAFKSGGNEEIILDKTTGYIVKNGDVKDLISKVEFLLDNEEISKEMGIKGKRRIENEFGIQKMIDEFYQIYSKLIQ